MASGTNKKKVTRGKGEQKASPGRIAAAKRRKSALDLKLSGMTYEAIGKEMGVTRQCAYKTVMSALEDLADEARPAAKEALTVELARLDRYLVKLDVGVESGDVQAIDKALKVQERRSKLCGLDAPSRHQVEVNVETEEQALEALAKEIRDNPEFRAWCLEKCGEVEG